MDVNQVWEEFGLGALEEGIAKLFPRQQFDLSHILNQVIGGDVMGAAKDLFAGLWSNIWGEFAGLKNIFIWLLVLGILSALVSHFVEIFDRNHVADLSFYFMYLLFMTVLIECFRQITGIASQTLESIMLFVKLLVPAYIMALGLSAGAVTAAVSYQMMLLVVYGVEYILAGVVLPLISGYCMLSMLNGVWMEEKLALLIDLLKKVIGWVLKMSLWMVTGISVFQSLIAPVVDSARGAVLHKLITAIPGIGNAAGGAVELVLGSALLLRNSIGVVLLLLLLFLCILPLAKIAAMAGMIKCAAAFMGVVSDKRITSCTDKVGEAGLLLLRTTATAMLLFLIAIAVTTALGRRVI